ncbi:MAG: sulfatase [Longimicrobiales bacterium]
MVSTLRITLVLAAGLLIACSKAPDPTSDPRPNFVVILTDDQRQDELEHMPSVMRRLAGEGLQFVHSFVTTPLCCPSRASFLSGRYAHNHGIRDLGGAPLFDATSTVAVWLQRAGYRTGLVGKYMNDNGLLAPEIPPGWDTWVTFADTPASFAGSWLYYDYELNVNGKPARYGNEAKDYSTDVLADFAVEFLNRSDGRPFFLLFSPFGPHLPAVPAPRHAGTLADLTFEETPGLQETDLGDKPGYVRRIRELYAQEESGGGQPMAEHWRAGRVRVAESLLAIDEAVERLLDLLVEREIIDDTVIVYTSDNGVLWGEHGLAGKQVPFEEAVRVPLIVRYPRMVPRARQDAHLVLNLDLAPTLAELAGAQAGDVDGTSLVPLLRGDAEVTWRSDFLIEGSKSSFTGSPYRAVRSAEWKYVWTGSEPAFEELYDLVRDPYETENLLVVTPQDPSVQRTADAMRRRRAELEAE